MKDVALSELLKGSAGIKTNRPAKLFEDNDPCEEVLDFSQRQRWQIQPVAPHMLQRHEGSCRCNSCDTGTSKSVWAGIDPDCGHSCTHGNAIALNIPTGQQPCLEASLPWDVWQAKTNPIYEPVWKFFSFHETARLLDQYSAYQLFTAGGEYSVLLAASHFVQLHLRINPNLGLAASTQASIGKAVAPINVALFHNKGIINSNFGSNHWSFSSHGLEYVTLMKGPVALAGMAWGI